MIGPAVASPRTIDAWREHRRGKAKLGNLEERGAAEEKLEGSLHPRREAFRIEARAAGSQLAEDLSIVRRAAGSVTSGSSRSNAGAVGLALESLEARFGSGALSRKQFDLLFDADAEIPVKGAPPSGRRKLPERLVESRLGRPLDEPPWARSALVCAIATSPDRLITHESTGAHLIRPGVGRYVYDHHGVSVGMGLVVHFDGGTGLGAPNVVALATLDQFSGGDVGSVTEARATSLLDEEFISLAPNVAAIRALGEVGYDNYKFLRNNCEHFATWATTGLRHSTQPRLRDQMERLANKTPTERGKRVSRRVAQELVGGPDIRMDRLQWAAPRSAESIAPCLIFDLGRAWYSPDLRDLVTYLPVWDPEHPSGLTPAGLPDTPWRVGGLDEQGWGEFNPAMIRERGWHACLVACVVGAHGPHPGKTTFAWVTSDGRWFDGVSEARMKAVFEQRIALANDTYQKVFRSGPASQVKAWRGKGFESELRGTRLGDA